MNKGDRVKVLLAGDEIWYNGTVINPKKQWVELKLSNKEKQ